MSAPAVFFGRETRTALRAGFRAVAAALRPPVGALAAVLRLAGLVLGAGFFLAADFFAPDFGDFASDLDVFFMATPAAGRGKARENFG
jgi:hypothetical protein